MRGRDEARSRDEARGREDSRGRADGRDSRDAWDDGRGAGPGAEVSRGADPRLRGDTGRGDTARGADPRGADPRSADPARRPEASRPADTPRGDDNRWEREPSGGRSAVRRRVDFDAVRRPLALSHAVRGPESYAVRALSHASPVAVGTGSAAGRPGVKPRYRGPGGRPAYLSMSPTTKNIEPRIAIRSGTSVPGSSVDSACTFAYDAVRSFIRQGVFSPRDTR